MAVLDAVDVHLVLKIANALNTDCDFDPYGYSLAVYRLATRHHAFEIPLLLARKSRVLGERLLHYRLLLVI